MAGDKKGLFVTFEGIDGCGKTTQLNLAARFLADNGHLVRTFREPGSTPVAEKIRAILLDNALSMTDATELFLYEAARADITANEIAPALQQGAIVLCDRFYDSTTAYQGYGRQLDVDMVKSLHRLAVADVVPDLTLVFDLDLKTASTRIGPAKDRLESESSTFHERVRRGFLKIAEAEPSRVKVIDAAPPVDVVFEDVKMHLLARIDKQ